MTTSADAWYQDLRKPLPHFPERLCNQDVWIRCKGLLLPSAGTGLQKVQGMHQSRGKVFRFSQCQDGSCSRAQNFAPTLCPQLVHI